MKPYAAIMVVVFVFVVGNASAELYKWVDEDGVAHFSNVAPPKDEDVSVSHELRGRPSTYHTPGMNKVLESYQRESTPPQYGGSAGKNKYDQDKIKYYADQVKRCEDRVTRYRDRMNEIKRTPYKDSRSHKDRLERHERWLNDAQRDLDEARSEYGKAMAGQ